MKKGLCIKWIPGAKHLFRLFVAWKDPDLRSFAKGKHRVAWFCLFCFSLWPFCFIVFLCGCVFLLVGWFLTVKLVRSYFPGPFVTSRTQVVTREEDMLKPRLVATFFFQSLGRMMENGEPKGKIMFVFTLFCLRRFLLFLALLKGLLGIMFYYF